MENALLARTASMHERIAMYNANALKIGIFGANCSSGRSATKVKFVTADHVGEGRFGVNLVAGWNEGEFEMFGVTQREHDARYDFAQE